MRAYKDAIQQSSGPTLPTLGTFVIHICGTPTFEIQHCCLAVLFVGDVKRQCGNEECVENPNAPEYKLINLRRYRPLTRAIRGMLAVYFAPLVSTKH